MLKFGHSRKSLQIGAIFCAILVLFAVSVSAENKEPVRAQNGMVTAAHPLAAEAGLEMLKLGGNAIDAMAATSFALGVVEPHASGLGGEGLMVIHMENPDKDVVIDGRAMAPLDATRDTMANDRHPRAAGVPGLVAAVLKAHQEYGKLPLKTVLQPAIRLASEGFPVSRTLAQVLLDDFELISGKTATAAIYYPDGFPPAEGAMLKNPDLAWSLQQLAENGVDAFYKGAIAEKLVTFMEAQGGIIGYDDLAAYKAVVREPARGTFRGYDVLSGGPPVSGTSVIANLNMWEQFNPTQFSYDDPLYIHIMSEIMKLTSADQYAYMGDPDFSSVPVRGMTSDQYARERFTQLSLAKATLPASIQPGPVPAYDNNVTFTQRVVGGPQAFGPSLYTTTAFADPFVKATAEGWKPVDGEWKVADGKLEGAKGTIISEKTFLADRLVEVNAQTVERYGTKEYSVGRLYGKYVDINNHVYVYLRTDGGIRFTVKSAGKSENYDAKVTVDPMQPHQYRLLFLGGKAELYIDGQLAIAVENEKMAAIAGGIGFWSQDSRAVYDNTTVRVPQGATTAAAAPAAATSAPAAAPAPAVPALAYKYKVMEESFTNGLGEFKAVDGEWSSTPDGAIGIDGILTISKPWGADRHVKATMKTLETLGKLTYNVGRFMGKDQDEKNRVYAYLRKDQNIRLSVVFDGKNEDFNFPAPGLSPFDEHVYEYFFNGNTVQFVIDGKVCAEVTNENISKIGGGITFWMQDSKVVAKDIVVEQTTPYEAPGSGSTTHMSIVDSQGNAVSLTQTISAFMGTGDVVPGAGFLLNNEMMNFGSNVNSLQPGKRMRTTTAPTILLDKGDVRLVVGSPGSARIITTVTEVIVNTVDFKMDIQSAINAPKFYSRNSEGNLQLEGRYPNDTIEFLKAYGHSLQLYPEYDLFFGGVHAVAVDPVTHELMGAADPRRDGAAVGY